MIISITTFSKSNTKIHHYGTLKSLICFYYHQHRQVKLYKFSRFCIISLKSVTREMRSAFIFYIYKTQFHQIVGKDVAYFIQFFSPSQVYLLNCDVLSCESNLCLAVRHPALIFLDIISSKCTFVIGPTWLSLNRYVFCWLLQNRVGEPAASGPNAACMNI